MRMGKMNIRKLYFDMDGVIVDFMGGVEELCGIPAKDQSFASVHQDDAMWEKIKEVEHFYYKLKPIPGMVEFVKNTFEKYGDDCQILTGIPKPRRGVLHADEDKRRWIAEYISPTIKVNVCFKEEKKNFVDGPGCVLVDDLQANIDDWKTAGGIGILFKNIEDLKYNLSDEIMKVKYIGEEDIVALDRNKVYEVISIEKGWYRIMTELDEDYLFPPEAFRAVE